jgi:hypothetical protein
VLFALAFAAQATVTGLTGIPDTLQEGVAFNGTVANFTSADSAFNATIDWGDGTTTPGTVVAAGAGSFNVNGLHTYAEEGNFTVSIDVTDTTDSTSGSTTAAFTVTEADSLTPSPVTFAPVEGAPFNGTVANFTDTYSGNVATDFVATINWGDGTTTPGTITGGGASYSVSGSHTYAEEGNYVVTVTLSDDAPGTASATAVSAANVTDAALIASGTNVTSTPLALTAQQVASFTDGNASAPASDFTATISWGDGSTSSGTITGGAGSFTVSGTYTYAAPGVYTIHTTINDVGGSSASTSSTATVGGSAIPSLSPMLLAALGVLLAATALRRTV